MVEKKNKTKPAQDYKTLSSNEIDSLQKRIIDALEKESEWNIRK